MQEGTVLDGRYRLIQPIGAGGFGQVWAAHDPKIDRLVAVKVLTGDASSSRQAARFAREAAVAGGLTHPNIVTVHDFGSTTHAGQACAYLVMELLPGEPLSRVLKAGRLPLPKALHVAACVADALKAAHDADLTHRDIKPSNIIIRSSGKATVVDFGITKSSDERHDGYAMRLVDEPLKGRALAVSMAGVSTALALGVPLGTYAGDLLGYRYTFAAIGVLALGVALWILATVQPFPGEPASTRIPLRQVFLLPGLAAILVTALLFEVGHMNLYTYVAPYLHRAALGDWVGPVLLAFGVAAMAGLFAAGAFIEKNLRAVVVGTLALFTLCMALFALLGTYPWPVIVVMFGWGFALGLAPTMFQAASAKAAGQAADVARQ